MYDWLRRGKPEPDTEFGRFLGAVKKAVADARWMVLKATHAGELSVVGVRIGCAMPADGRRVLNQKTFLEAIGRSGNAHEGVGDGPNLQDPRIPGRRQP